jgi:hypothetical protein
MNVVDPPADRWGSLKQNVCTYPIYKARVAFMSSVIFVIVLATK